MTSRQWAMVRASRVIDRNLQVVVDVVLYRLLDVVEGVLAYRDQKRCEWANLTDDEAAR